MKRKIILVVGICFYFGHGVNAQTLDPVSLILSKAIKAIDLKVQRLQNETLVLQQEQQQAEQKLSKQKLEEISSWHSHVSTLYAGYFTELKQIKPMISGGTSVRQILAIHEQIKLVYGKSQKDALTKPHYDAIVNYSQGLVQTLQLILSGQMALKDAEKIEMIGTVQQAMQESYHSMRSLDRQQREIIAERKRRQTEVQIVKRLYAIQ